MYANKSNSSYAHSALSLKISSINLYNFIEPPNAFYHSDQIYTNQQWQRKCAWVTQAIACLQSDLIGFQEVFSPDVLKSMMLSLGYPYFAVVDKPQALNHYTFKKPVVCLASRYPILNMLALQANETVSRQLGLDLDFGYARSPLQATVELPSLGTTDIYVVHLKSHRPMTDELTRPNSIKEMICYEITGDCRSRVQRSAEASQLMISIIARRFETNNPVILMGDFNDELNADALDAFNLKKLRTTMQYLTDLPVSYYQLHDSWQLFEKDHQAKQLATHFYNGIGSTLDYILLSSEFNSGYINNIAEVTEFQCQDTHVTKGYHKELETSDHGIISTTVSLIA